MKHPEFPFSSAQYQTEIDKLLQEFKDIIRGMSTGKRLAALGHEDVWNHATQALGRLMLTKLAAEMCEQEMTAAGGAH